MFKFYKLKTLGVIACDMIFELPAASCKGGCFFNQRRKKVMKNFILGITATIICCVFEARAENISCINGLREDKTTPCDKCGDNCDWEIKDGVLKVSGSGSMYDYADLISDDKPWRGYEADINHLTIEGISNIGSRAFSSFRNLSSVEMDNSVTEVGIRAFAWTGPLSVKMYDSISYLGN